MAARSKHQAAILVHAEMLPRQYQIVFEHSAQLLAAELWTQVLNVLFLVEFIKAEFQLFKS